LIKRDEINEILSKKLGSPPSLSKRVSPINIGEGRFK